METNRSDPFIYRENVKKRWIEEYKKYGKLIIAYDFDYTVHNYREEDEYAYDVVMNLLREWRPYAKLVVFSASPESRFDYIKEYLNNHNIPFDTINEDSIVRPYETRKIYYNVFLDDRAGLGEVVQILTEILKDIKENNI